MSNQPKLGIIAGGGSGPRRVAEACIAQGRAFFIFRLDGQVDEELPADWPQMGIPLGAFGKLKATIAAEGIGELVMIGKVRRPSLTELKPDWLAVKFLAKIGFNSLGDDALLRAIGKVLEEETGARMIGAHEILGGILMKTGLLGTITPDTQAESDILRGVEVARLLGQADVGQSVIVQQGLVLGVEAIEGTDALIARCAILRREGAGAVLVKLAKPQQDERFDLPTIGPETILSAAKAGLCGIAVEAGRSLLIDREKVRELADQNGLFVLGIG